MDQVVIDASVFVKLLIDEEYSDKAYSLRDAYIEHRIEVIVPSIFHYEVLNAVKYSKAYSKEELESIGGILENYRFQIFNFNASFAKVIADLATKHDITIYDAAYIALANMTNSKFYTSDGKLILKVNLPFIKHIKEFV